MSEEAPGYGDKKNSHGGARRKTDPVKGAAKRRTVFLYDFEKELLVKQHGSLTKALRWAVANYVQPEIEKPENKK